MAQLTNTLLNLGAAALLMAVVWGAWALLGVISKGLGLSRLHLLGLGWITGLLR